MSVAFLYLDGKENIDIAEKFCNGYCYRRILDHGKFLAQLEVVIPYGERGYTIAPQKDGLISVGFVDINKIEKVLHQLGRLGFSGFVNIEGFDDNDGQGNTIFEFFTII